jgi:hypothetical protein
MSKPATLLLLGLGTVMVKRKRKANRFIIDYLRLTILAELVGQAPPYDYDCLKTLCVLCGKNNSVNPALIRV